MKQIKDLPNDWAVYLGDKSMPKWKEALDCYNELMRITFEGSTKFYTRRGGEKYLSKYKKVLTPEEFVSHFEIEPTIEDELAAMRYKVGDIIVNDFKERKVLGFCYFVSASNEHNVSSNKVFTQKELDDLKYKKK